MKYRAEKQNQNLLDDENAICAAFLFANAQTCFYFMGSNFENILFINYLSFRLAKFDVFNHVCEKIIRIYYIGASAMGMKKE